MKTPRTDRKLRQAANMLGETISSAGHLPFVATDEIASHGLTAPKVFMPFVRRNLRDAGLLILLYHPDLRGGLIEAGLAYAWEIPIWLCCQPGQRVSSSMRGCADVTIEYENLDDLQAVLLKRLTGQASEG